MKNHPKWLGSSQDSTKISRTLKTLPTLILFVAMMLKIDIPESQIDEWVGALVVVLNGGATLYYGSVRIYSNYIKPWRDKRR